MAFAFKHGQTPLEGYTIQRGVGRGGFGEVYYAISDAGKEVALKYLRDNVPVELRGVSQCMNLKSPYLVTLFDVKTNADDDTFVVMEYVHGPSLRDVLIAEPKGLGLQKAAYFTREIAKGLGYLHDRGIVHRDLKPGNIFYEDGYVKIGDYGLSKFISVSKHSGQTASVGTVHYMAPEVGSGNYHRGIDIYSLGVMLYEMLCGRVPFEGASLGEVLMKHLVEQPDLDGFPSPVSDVIRKALAKDPQDRYQRVEEMIEDLFEVDDVANSVAGFVPTSLSAAVKRIEVPTPPPVPKTPNGEKGAGPAAQTVPPLRPEAPPQPTAPEVSPNLSPEAWERYADAMEQWGKRFGDEMDQWGKTLGKKLAGRGDRAARHAARHAERVAKHARRAAHKAGKAAGPHAARMAAAAEPYVQAARNQKQRIVVAMIVTAALAVMVGLLAQSAELIPISFYAIVGLTASVIVAERLGHQVVAFGGHNILRRLLAMACAFPVLFVGAILLDGVRGIDLDGLGGGILIATGLIDWGKRLQEGVYGKSSLSFALAAALVGGIVTVLFEDDAALAVAGLMGSVSLISQTVAPVFLKPILEPIAGSGESAGVSNDGPPPPPPVARLRVDRAANAHNSDPAGPATIHPRDWQPVPRTGGGFRRFFWMFIAAGLVSAGAICFTSLGVLKGLSREEEAQLICLGTGLCVFGLFPLWQALRFGTRGFWMGLVRRFVTVTGITIAAVGGCMIGLENELGLGDDDLVAAIGMTIVGGVFGTFFLLLGLRPSRSAEPFHGAQPVGDVS